MHPWLRVLVAKSHKERAVFWLGLCVAYGLLAGLATWEGVVYVLRSEPTANPFVTIAVPVYNPVLWLPAVLFGAGAWGPLGWLNTLYWLIVAGLAATGAARLLVRHPSRARRPHPAPSAARGRAPGPHPGRPAVRPSGRPSPPPAAPAEEPPAPALAQSAR